MRADRMRRKETVEEIQKRVDAKRAARVAAMARGMPMPEIVPSLDGAAGFQAEVDALARKYRLRTVRVISVSKRRVDIDYDELRDLARARKRLAVLLRGQL